MTLIATELIPSPNQSAAPNSIRRIAFLNVEGSAFARCSMSSSSPLLLSPSVVVGGGASVAASQLSTGACEDDDDDVKAAAAAAAAVAAHAAALAPALCFCAAALAAQAARKEAPHQLDGAGGAVGTLRGGATRFAVEVSLTGVATVILLAAPLARDGLQVVHTFVKLRSSARCVASIAGAAQGRPTCGVCGEVMGVLFGRGENKNSNPNPNTHKLVTFCAVGNLHSHVHITSHSRRSCGAAFVRPHKRNKFARRRRRRRLLTVRNASEQHESAASACSHGGTGVPARTCCRLLTTAAIMRQNGGTHRASQERADEDP